MIVSGGEGGGRRWCHGDGDSGGVGANDSGVSVVAMVWGFVSAISRWWRQTIVMSDRLVVTSMALLS